VLTVTPPNIQMLPDGSFHMFGAERLPGVLLGLLTPCVP
jgi:hypothetical protein